MGKSIYSREERIAIVRDCIVNKLSDKEIEDKYCLASPSLLRVWRFRYAKTAESLVKFEKSANFASPKPVTKDPVEEMEMAKRKTEAELIAELNQVKKELEYEKLKVDALNILIDIAEREGIKIRKKSGAKQ